jgi:tetratricopeptide (TPR) repeat protein
MFNNEFEELLNKQKLADAEAWLLSGNVSKELIEIAKVYILIEKGMICSATSAMENVLDLHPSAQDQLPLYLSLLLCSSSGTFVSEYLVDNEKIKCQSHKVRDLIDTFTDIDRDIASARDSISANKKENINALSAVADKVEYPYLFNYLGVEYLAQENLNIAEKLFRRVIKINKEDYCASINLSHLLLKKGNFLEAHALLSELEYIYKSDITFNINFLICKYKLTDYTDTIQLCKRVLEIDTKNYYALVHLSNSYARLKKIDKSLLVLKNLIELYPSCTSSWLHYSQNMLIGENYDKSRDLLLEAYNAVAPDQKPLISSQLLYNLLSNYHLDQNEKYRVDSHVKRILSTQNGLNLKVCVLLTIYYLMGNQRDRSSEFLNLSLKLIEDKHLDFCSFQDAIFCSAYTNFLRRKMDDLSWGNNLDQSVNLIYHCGDSHCLTATGIAFMAGDQGYVIKSAPVFGAKVFHLGHRAEFGCFGVLKKQLENVEMGAKIILSFGEIDCRMEEGFLPACDFNPALFQESCEAVINSFFQEISGLTAKLKCDFYFTNVPAPMYLYNFNSIKNQKRSELIKIYNSAFENCIVHYDYRCIDLYSLTLGPDGFSNSKHHVDPFHISSEALIKQLSLVLN